MTHDQAERAVYTVPEAARILGLGRNAAYAAAQRGDIPTLRIGRLLLVPKIPFHRMLGIAETVTATRAETADVGAKLAIAEKKGKTHDRPNIESAKPTCWQPSNDR